jgi:hypothetical protein
MIGADPRDLGHRSTAWAVPPLVRHLRDHLAVEVSRGMVSRDDSQTIAVAFG